MQDALYAGQKIKPSCTEHGRDKFDSVDDFRCNNCKEPGHSKKDSDDFKCNYCKEPGHFKKDCPKLEKKIAKEFANLTVEEKCEFGFQPELALHVEAEADQDCSNKWFLDSACSHHMTGERSLLKKFSV